MARVQELTAFSKFGWEVVFAIDRYRETRLFLFFGDIRILIFWSILLNALFNYRSFKGSGVFWFGPRLLLGFGRIGGRS